MTFATGYVYEATGPDCFPLENPSLMPDGFHNRPLAVTTLGVG